MYYFDNLIKEIDKIEESGLGAKTSELIDKVDIINTKRSILNENGDLNHFVINTHTEKIKEVKFDSKPTKELINKMVNEIYDRDSNQIEYVKKMAEVREIEPEGLIENHCFFSPNISYIESLYADLNVYKKDFHITTAENTLWKGRFIIPLRDFNNEVFGFVGYDKFSEAKYVEYSSPMYKAIQIKALGLNDVREILDKRYCIFTEGSFDYFRARQHGFPVIANLGIRFNKLIKPLIDRLDVVFTAYDNDDTGRKNMDSITTLHPYTYYIQFNEIEKEDGKKVKGDMDEALKDETKVIRMRKEINKKLEFKNVYQTKRILI